jgi:hypothetical protein
MVELTLPSKYFPALDETWSGRDLPRWDQRDCLKQSVVRWINNTGLHESARHAFKSIAFKAALIDFRPVAAAKYEPGIASGAWEQSPCGGSFKLRI